MKTPGSKAFALVAILIGGCVITRGSHVLVGTPRAPTSPAEVKLYTTLPAQYEQIAIISATAAHDFVTDQKLTDAAIDRLKREAAKVGANGILLNGVGNYQIGSSGVVIIPNTAGGAGTGTVVANTRTGKEAEGIAIFVPAL